MTLSTQMVAGINACKNALNLDPWIITDKYNNMRQHHLFEDNRHDQSIISVALKKVGHLPWIRFWEYDYGRGNMPFHSARIKE